MLESMRKNIKSLQVMLWLVVAAFIGSAIVGGALIGRGGRTGRQNAVAWVNGESISYANFESRYRNMYALYKQVYGDNLTREMLENLDLPQKTLDQLTEEVLLSQEAREYDLQVSDRKLVQMIREMTQFHKDNRFDAEVYTNTLKRVGLTPEEFEEQVADSLLVQQMETLIKQTVRVTDREVLADYRLKNEKITVEGLLVKAEHFKDQAEVTDEEIQSFYETHTETFRTPERVKIQYIHFDPQQIKQEITLTEEDIRAYYDDHQDEFDAGKEVKARHILFQVAQDADEETVASVKAKAEDVLQQVKEGADFAEMAEQYSEDTGTQAKGGDLGFFAKGQMVPEFEEAAFRLNPGEISDLVRSQFGFHIIKVEDVREEDPYEKAKPTIRDRLKLAEAKDIARERAEISYEDVLDIGDLEEVAAQDDLTVHVSDFFGKGEKIDEKTFALPQIQNVAFTLDATDPFSQPIETPAGYYIIEFLERKAPYIPELAQVRDDVAKTVREENMQELAQAHAEEIAAALSAGTAWETISEEFSEVVETFSPKAFSRRQQYIPETRGNTEEFVDTAFALKEGQHSPVIELSENYAIIRVTERIGIDMEQFEAKKDELRKQFLRQKQGTVFREFVEELRQQAEIDIVPNLFS